MPAIPAIAIDPKKAARRRKRIIQRTQRRVLRKAEKAAAKQKEAQEMSEAQRAQLSVNPERKAAWQAYLAGLKAKDEAVMAAVRQRRLGRNGEVRELVQEQAADANERATVIRNVAADPIEWLFSRKSLTQRQYEAAQRIRRDAEAREIGPCRASDYARPVVQGGGQVGSITDRQADAIRRYTQCMDRLGEIGGELVRRVVIECRPLKDVGEQMGMDKNYRAPRLGEALDVAAGFYRL